MGDTGNAADVPAPAPAPAPPSPARSLATLVVSLIGSMLSIALLGFLSWWEVSDKDVEFHRSLGAILTAALFLTLGLCVVGITSFLFPGFTIRGDVLFVTIILAPIVVYLILVGQVSKLNVSGFEVDLDRPIAKYVVGQLPVGGLGTAQHLAAQPCAKATSGVKATAIPFTNPLFIPSIPLFPPLLFPGQKVATPPPATTEAIVGGGPVVYLKLVSDSGCAYDGRALATRVAELSQSGSFKFIVLVHRDDEYFADIPAAAASGIMRNNPNLLVDAVQNDPKSLGDPTKFPGVEFHALRTSDTTVSALKLMQDRNLDALVVVDGDGHLQGVITQAQIQNSMLQEIATNVSQ